MRTATDEYGRLRSCERCCRQVSAPGCISAWRNCRQGVLVDCVEAHPSRWFSGPVAFVLTDQRPLPFIECRGMLNFFTVPDEAAAAVAEAATTPHART